MATNIPIQKKQIRTKKAKDAPRRPLSAYNLYFKYQRALMLAGSDATSTQDTPIVIGGSYSGMLSADGHTVVQPVEGSRARPGKREHRRTHGKISFAELARQIGQKWRSLDDAARKPFVEQARVEKERYREEIRRYKERKAMDVEIKEETISDEHDVAAADMSEILAASINQKKSAIMEDLDDIEPICIFPPIPANSSNAAA